MKWLLIAFMLTIPQILSCSKELNGSFLEETKEQIPIKERDSQSSFTPSAKVMVIKGTSEGDFLIGGEFDYMGTQRVSKLAKLKRDKSLDLEFQKNIGEGFNGNVLSILELEDGRLVVGGEFTQFNGAPANSVVILKSNGKLDATFSKEVGEGFNDIVRSLHKTEDGRILVVGDFNQYREKENLGLMAFNWEWKPAEWLDPEGVESPDDLEKELALIEMVESEDIHDKEGEGEETTSVESREDSQSDEIVEPDPSKGKERDQFLTESEREVLNTLPDDKKLRKFYRRMSRLKKKLARRYERVQKLQIRLASIKAREEKREREHRSISESLTNRRERVKKAIARQKERVAKVTMRLKKAKEMYNQRIQQVGL